ncbi:MAG: secondary thiamine-phosphate synthase enzyme YjbQ [Candidatus Polarisedimenticolaceae bacterium]|nr:secondary thiamine-phosphate synthase enzyme YjbQ [Candidatus Polarisedimenticolaceae bacterium]
MTQWDDIMTTHQDSFQVSTPHRGTYEITDKIEQIIHQSGIRMGVCQVFTHHTSASLILCENADPSVRSDLESFLHRLVPDSDPIYDHIQEGADDMPAHIRSILTNMDLSFPVTQGRSGLGTWQGVYLYEHRTQPHRRRVTVTIIGD